MSSDIETQDRKALLELQLKRLQSMLGPILQNNAFYKQKLNDAGITRPEDIRTVADYQRLPFTSKTELSTDQIAHPPYGTNLTGSQDQFVRVHQTSGTTGQPLRCMDTDESWTWFAQCWKRVYQGAGVIAADRIFFAFSFGPFIGFWTALEGARL
ncbi:MAG: phenylacetate--CoA ligase family protein, partial [Candidatus Latescibacteria bacterium]|nr:phenylacetate--CoA ligase family protein [Candidatus Latescibacterota bacterium]